MARKPASSSRSSKPASRTAKAVKTAVRNTAVPRAGIAPSTRQPGASRPAASKPAAAPAPARKSQPTRDQIARRAYEIWRSGTGGSETDNWLRAERELRG